MLVLTLYHCHSHSAAHCCRGYGHSTIHSLVVSISTTNYNRRAHSRYIKTIIRGINSSTNPVVIDALYEAAIDALSADADALSAEVDAIAIQCMVGLVPLTSGRRMKLRLYGAP